MSGTVISEGTAFGSAVPGSAGCQPNWPRERTPGPPANAGGLLADAALLFTPFSLSLSCHVHQCQRPRPIHAETSPKSLVLAASTKLFGLVSATGSPSGPHRLTSCHIDISQFLIELPYSSYPSYPSCPRCFDSLHGGHLQHRV